jgi:hypothetical protein
MIQNIKIGKKQNLVKGNLCIKLGIETMIKNRNSI